MACSSAAAGIVQHPLEWDTIPTGVTAPAAADDDAALASEELDVVAGFFAQDEAAKPQPQDEDAQANLCKGARVSVQWDMPGGKEWFSGEVLEWRNTEPEDVRTRQIRHRRRPALSLTL